MASRKFVSASTVREWFAGLSEADQAEVVAPGSRGRLHPKTIAAFKAANKGLTYEPKVAEAKTVTVSYPALDKAGRKRTASVTMTLSEARALLGAEGKRGRLSLDNLTDILAQQYAAEVSDQFVGEVAA